MTIGLLSEVSPTDLGIGLLALLIIIELIHITQLSIRIKTLENEIFKIWGKIQSPLDIMGCIENTKNYEDYIKCVKSVIKKEWEETK